jgi:hypothetical protein
MTDEERKRMLELCAQIAVEKNQEKFMDLITELNNLLDVKTKRLTDGGTKASKS